jgi:tRNA (guanine-N7-)-methyltransferase
MAATEKIIFPKFRTRPHSNPLSDQIFDYPLSPAFVDWGKLFENPSQPLWCDLGCGYGGLLETLGPRFQAVNIIGMEIRSQVVDYVENRIVKLRRGEIPHHQLHINPVPQECLKPKDATASRLSPGEQKSPEEEDAENPQDQGEDSEAPSDDAPEEPKDVSPVFRACLELAVTNPLQGVDVTDLSFARPSPPVVRVPRDQLVHYKFMNIGVIRANSMKTMGNFFRKGALSRLFILFPDPHWKPQHIRRRVVSPSLLDEYAYCIEQGGRVYTITDVPIVHHWMVWCFEHHPLFQRVPESELVCPPSTQSYHDLFFSG